MGLGAQFGYQELSLNLVKGDLLILTSDGLVEANNVAGELFGFDRVEQAVACGPTTSAEAMLDHLKAEAAAFVGQTEPHDDMTIVVVQV
jgi:sigma-B regulation protein RsbU (phosphoserine phosphatase)